MSANRRIFLLYPPISKRERYSSSLGAVGGQQIPLGVFSLAGFLRRHDYEVMVTDAECLDLSDEEIVERVMAFAPLCVGISSSTVAFRRALAVARALKVACPSLPIILGGPHVTANPEHALSFPEIDYGVLGEGELTLLEIVEALSKRRELTLAISGLALRLGDGTVVRAPTRPYIGDLNSLPFPAYDLIDDLKRYAPPPSNYRTLPVVNMITSRGCPNECTFCDRNVFGRNYRERSAAHVAAEMIALRKRYGVREIAFVDDTFLINPRRVLDIFARLRARDLFFHWTCMARINNLDEKLLVALRDNGCWSIAFGIESGDPQILKVVRKNIALEQVERVIGLCHRLRIQTKGFFILGHPTETEASIDMTIRFALSLKLTSIVVTLNTPIPGSAQYAESSRYGALDVTDWSQFNYWRPVFVPHGLTRELLLAKQRELYLRFYLQPRVAWSTMKGFVGKGGWRRFRSVMGLAGYLRR